MSLPLFSGTESDGPGATGSGGTGPGGTGLGGPVLDGVGAWLDAGRTLALGLVPAARPEPGRDRDWHDYAQPALGLIDRVGFARTILSRQVLVTPEAGLAGSDPRWARTALGLAKRIAAAFSAEPEDL